MAKLNEIYKCEVCGNIIEVVHASVGQLVCCGKSMRLLEENTTDAALEKHVPVVQKIEDGLIVKIGEVQHPMEEKHYIEWIEVITQNKVYKKYLKPGQKPEAKFKLDEEVIKVREYCNIHGLWKK